MADRIGVKLSHDALLAQLTIAQGPAADMAAIEATLAKAGITEGIDWALLARTSESLSDPNYTLDEVIARGRPPVEGADG